MFIQKQLDELQGELEAAEYGAWPIEHMLELRRKFDHWARMQEAFERKEIARFDREHGRSATKG